MSCGCVWSKDPAFGDVVIEQCAEHAAQRAALEARERAIDLIALENRTRMMLDVELDRVVCGRRW